MSDGVIAAAPDWSLERAAAEMSRRGIRHLAVYDGPELVGVLSMRDIVRVWTSDGATSGMSPRTERCGALASSAALGRGMVSTGSTAPRTFCLRRRRKKSRTESRTMRPEEEQRGDAGDHRVDPAADHEALGVDAADDEGEGEGEEGRQPGGAGRVDQLAGLGDCRGARRRS